MINNVWEARDRRDRRAINRKRSYSHFAQYDGQRVAPTCPPDNRVHVRGGWMMTAYGQHFNTEPKIADFGPDGNHEIESFTNANYYRGCMVLRCYCYSVSEYEFGNILNIFYTDETSTAVCAEQLTDWEMHNTLYKSWGYPLCAIIFKNDGTIGTPGAILPIDATNRGRSYLWRDIRPFIFADGWGANVPKPPAPCT